MATEKEKRLRVSFDADDEVLRRAIYIAAAMLDKSHNDVICGILRKSLGKYIELAEEAIRNDEPTPAPRRGRPSKRDGDN